MLLPVPVLKPMFKWRFGCASEEVQVPRSARDDGPAVTYGSKEGIIFPWIFGTIEPGLFMNGPPNALVRAAPRLLLRLLFLFSSPGLQAGVIGAIYFTGRFSGLPEFRLQPSLASG